MTCTWCPNDAITIGRAPAGTVGQTQLPSCEIHKQVLRKLNYIEMPEIEFRKELKREAREAKK